MPRTPDRFPGEREEEELRLEPHSADPDSVGGMRIVSGAFRFRDDLGVFDPRSGGSGITAEQHKVLRQLIHFIDGGPGDGFYSNPYMEVTGGIFPTEIVWWDSSSKTKKLVRKVITRSGGGASNLKPTPIVWEVYDTDGSTILVTMTDVITYSGVTVASISRSFA